MKFFFAIPFFSNAVYLEKTLESVIAQSYTDWTAVVLDDSILEKEGLAAKEVVDRILSTHPTRSITYHKNPRNLGLAKNWNQGLDLGASSKFTTILHADDCLKLDYCEEIVRHYSSHPDATAFFCRTEIIGEHGQKVFSFADTYKLFLLPDQDVFTLQGMNGIASLIPGNFIFCPTLCFVNAKVGKERFREDRKQVPDFDFTVRILLKNEQLVGLYERPLYQYRRHAQNTTALQGATLLRFEEERDFYLDLARTLEAKGRKDLAIKARALKILKKNLWFNVVMSALRLRFEQAARYFKFLKAL